MYLPIALVFGAGIANAANVPESVPSPIGETHLPMKVHSQIRANHPKQAPIHKAAPVAAPLPPNQQSIAAAIAPSSASSLPISGQHPSPISHLYNGNVPQFKPAYFLSPPPAPKAAGLSALISSALAGFSNKLGRRSGKTSSLDSALYNLNAIPESAGNGLDLNNIQALNDMIGSALNTYAPGALPGAQIPPTAAQVGLMNTISSFVSNNLSKGKKMFEIPKAFYKSLGEKIIGSTVSGDLQQAASNIATALPASVPLKESIVSTIKSALSYLKPARSSGVAATVDSGNLKRRTSDPFYAQNQQWLQNAYQQGQFGAFPGQQGQIAPAQGQQQMSESQRQPQLVAHPEGPYQQFGYGNANELAMNPNGYGHQNMGGYQQFVQQPPVHKSSFYKKSRNWISGKFQRKQKHPQQQYPMMMEHGQYAQQNGQFYPQPNQQGQPQIPQQGQPQQQQQQQPQIQQQPQPSPPPKSQLPSQTMAKVHNKLGNLPDIFNQKTQPQPAHGNQQFIPLQPQGQQSSPMDAAQPSGQLDPSFGQQWNQQSGQSSGFFTQQPQNSMFNGYQGGYQANGQHGMFNGPQVAGTVASSTVSPFATSPSMNVDLHSHSAAGMDEHLLEEHPSDSAHDQGLYFFDQAHHQTAAESVHHEETVKPDASAPMPSTGNAQSQHETQPKAQSS